MSLTRLPRTLHITIRALAVACVLGIGAGCIFDPDEGGPGPPPPFQYPPLDSPENALLNIKHAWDRKDSVRTREVYDDDYFGTAPNPQGGPAFTFTKDQEVAVVWAIGQDPSVYKAEMDLKTPNTWVRVRFDTDPAGWQTIQLLQGVRLQVSTTSTDYVAATSDVEYKFKPYATGTDTTWKVVRWTETPN